MPTKTCLRCGQDCSNKPRIRDQHGRYVCKACLRPDECETLGIPLPQRPPGLDPHPDSSDDVFAIAPEDLEQIGPTSKTCPACAKTMPPDAVLCVSCGYDTRKGFQVGTGLGASATSSGVTKCPHCGYSLKGLKSRVCPECGKNAHISKAEQLRMESRRAVRRAYMTPAVMIAAGLGTAVLVLSVSGLGLAVLPVLIEWPFNVGFGLAAYLCLCALWLGFDAPLHLSALRMGAVYATAAGIGSIMLVLGGPCIMVLINIPVFLILLRVMMDIEWLQVIVLVLLLILVKIVVGVAVVAIMAQYIA